ncbi:MFS transporter [Luteimonas fraxinea]|uniref:MFS transporter n=1 Tax=Luteimonas fraxinea TaxID=2901869 RepID=A0ABS8U756_9GAMM|nr:MFS transporter [Luteimonas fraxinea]MCD9095535.1 MFS transporter [Luteimonas fraxinea]MCD9126224.1 MFS transporter [Luteimonas fraxinea]UHH11264.1 MFS transporter [Luteimonas fraxinea]
MSRVPPASPPSATVRAHRYAPRDWAPHERPMMPGSPSTPLHSTRRRIAFGIVGFIVAMTGGLGNALVTANLVNLQGALGAYASEIAWLPAAYVMTNVSMNILLVKFRQQFGLRLFTEAFLILYALITLAHLFVNDLGSAIAVRAGHGIAGAALNTLGLYYMLQAFPQKHRLRGLVIGLGIAQLALPLARVFSTDLLEFGEWRGLYMFELGLALVALGGVLLLKLPPGDRHKAFEPLDFVTFGLFAPGIALLTAVLAQGRLAWWTETAWLGWALAGAFVLVTAAIAIEHFRARPLLNTRWLATGSMLRLALAIVLIRIVLSEQATGAVGFLQALGLGNEQMRTLFVIVLIGSVAGLATSALTINPAKTWQPVLISLALMMTGALMDAQASNVTRPEQMYVSQFLLAFGSTFFLGPMLIAGIGPVISQPRNLISFVVLFGMTQNLGGLLGSALLGTFQTMREKFHSSVLTEHLTLLDPLVAARVQATANGYSATIADPAQRNALAVRALGSAATREANVLAYNDVFLLIAFIAFCTLVWIIASRVWARLRAAPATPASPPSSAAPDSA